MRRTRKGFSLVELLVVIGIIALLLGILLPVFARARRMARATVCLTHLQQLSDSYHMYLSANRNRSFAMYDDITQLAWWELLQPYNGAIADTILCPQATEPGNIIGGAYRAWGPHPTYSVAQPQWTPRGVWVGSYGINQWLYQALPVQRPQLPDDWRQRAIELPTQHSERVPVFGDCIMDWAGPDSSDTVPANLVSPIPYYSGIGPRPIGPRGQMAYFCIDRHERAINIAFLDGHAERVRLEDLWKLRWNNSFEPRNVVIP